MSVVLMGKPPICAPFESVLEMYGVSLRDWRNSLRIEKVQTRKTEMRTC